MLRFVVHAMVAGGFLVLTGDRQEIGAMMQMKLNPDCAPGGCRAVAARLLNRPDSEGLPQSAEWEKAQPVIFSGDWRGQHPDPLRDTEVRLLWSPEYLFLRFRARYREIHVFPESKTRRDQLWLRDVVEAFIRPDTDELRHYREFEICPNGNWLDLDIDHGRKSDLGCDLKSRVTVDAYAHFWTAVVAIPMSCLVRQLDPRAIWRINFFRVEGSEPDRFYSAWRPTNTAQPNFHVPEVFGELRFLTEYP
jgi:alpha-galactosidase